MMNVIGRFCDDQYIYSIDESFLQLKNYGNLVEDWHEYAHEIRKTVWREVRLPVGVGIGSTPTLAKAANHAAKKLSGYYGVAVIDNEKERKAILARMELTDVWGIGSRLAKRLGILGLKTALDLANQDPKVMRAQFSVMVERTVNELNGMPCLTWSDVRKSKQEIFSTRSFGERITNYHALKAALSTHGAIVCRKVRLQGSLIKKFRIFVASSLHDENYYKNSFLCEVPIATENTLAITRLISNALDQSFAEGVRYYRCGVGAL
jgi:DNA polymerase V